jgi:hypothetical protein
VTDTPGSTSVAFDRLVDLRREILTHMPTVTFVLGLCGSGKSWLAENLRNETGAEWFDEPIGRNTESDIVQCLQDGRDCVVEELFYCCEYYRSQMLARLRGIANPEIRFVCFDNALESANRNVERRTNKGEIQKHLELNRRVSPFYTFPADCERRAIHRIG